MGAIPAPEPNVSATAGVPSTPAAATAAYRASEALGKHMAVDAPTSPASAVIAPSASHGSLAASPDIHGTYPDRQYTPGMTRADLAAKREAEQQRQTLLFQQRGLGKSAEPEIRTSFSDDIGRAFDTISSARSPSPEAQSPTNASANSNANASTNASKTQAPTTPTPAGRVTTATATSRLGDANNTNTATPNNASSRDRLSATPQTQPRSLPQRAPSSPLPPDNVTAVTLDGDTTVFFIDDGLKLPDSTPATPVLVRREGAEPDVYEEDQHNHTDQQDYHGETDQPSQQDQQARTVGQEESAPPRGLGIMSGEVPVNVTTNRNAFALRTGGSGAGAAGLGAAAVGAAGAGAALASGGGEHSRPSSAGVSAPSDPSRGTSTDTAPTATASASAPGTTAFPARDVDADAEPEERQGHVGRASLGAVGGTSAFAAMQLASATQRGDARAMSTASITAIHGGMEGSSPKHLDSLASPMTPDSPSRPSPLGRLSLASGRLKSPLSPPLEAPGTPWAPSGTPGTASAGPGTPLLAAPGTPLVAASNAEMEAISIDTARAGEPDTETASITAIRAGREGTWPVSPGVGKSPLSPVAASSDSATDSMQDVSNAGTPGANGTRSGTPAAAAAAAVAGGAAATGLAATRDDATTSPTADTDAVPPTAAETASTVLPTAQAPGEDHESVGHPATRGQAATARDPAPYPPAQRDGPAEHELPHAAHGETAKHALHADEHKVAHALHPHGEHEHGHEHGHERDGAGAGVAAGAAGVAAGHAVGHDAEAAGNGPADVNAEPREAVLESGDTAAPTAPTAAKTDAPAHTHTPTAPDAPPSYDAPHTTDLHSPTSDASGYHTPPSTADSTALTGAGAGFTPAAPAVAASAPKAETADTTTSTAKEAEAAAKPKPATVGDAASASYASKFARRAPSAGTAAGTGNAATLGAASTSATGTGAAASERPANAGHQRNTSTSSSSRRKGGLLSRLKGLGGKISHE